MAHVLKFIENPAFLVEFPDGSKLRFLLKSRWNGLEEWALQSDERKTMIVSPSRSRAAGLFGVFLSSEPNQPGEITVVSASPELAALLQVEPS